MSTFRSRRTIVSNCLPVGELVWACLAHETREVLAADVMPLFAYKYKYSARGKLFTNNLSAFVRAPIELVRFG